MSITAPTMMSPDSIIVDGRYREDLGDIAGLADSIRKVGLLQRIVVTPDGRLVAGVRRLEALKSLGWHEIPVQVAHSLDSAAELLQAERDENVCRKDFAPLEIAAIGRTLEQYFKPKATNSSLSNLKRGEWVPSGSPEPVGERVREQVGDALGISGASYERIKAVARDAENEALPPERREAAAEALERMDQGVGIRTAHDEYRHQIKAAQSVVKPASEMGRHERDMANAARRRTETLVGQCQAFPRGLPELKVEMAVQVATPEEIKGWQQEITGGIRALTAFRKRLEVSSAQG